MPRSALVIGEAIGPEQSVTSILKQFGLEGVSRAADVQAALQLIALGHIAVVFVAVDDLDEQALAQLDRGARLATHTEVIGTAVRKDTDFMLRAMRAGIQEFLVRPVDAAELTAAMQRVSRRHTATVTGQLFACYAAKGGLGVSSVAANLAHSLAAIHKAQRVAIADFVVPNGEQRLQFNIDPAYDLRDVATRADRIDHELLNSVMAPTKGGVWLLASSEDPDVDDVLDANVTNAILTQLRAGYHLTVVDCDGQLNDRTLAVLDAADRILLVTQLNVSALRSSQRSLNIFRRLGYPEEKLCVIVNRFQSGDVISIADAKEVMKTDVYFRLPNDYKTMAEAVSRGVPVAQVGASSDIATAFVALARKLAGSVERNGEALNGKGVSRLRGIFSRKK